MKNKKTKQPISKYDIETAYRAAATTLSFIINTRESFAIRELDIRGEDLDFAYCYPNDPKKSESRDELAVLCEIMGTIAGHALYTGEIFSIKDFGFDKRECIEHLDKQAKILIDLCRNQYNGFFQNMVRRLSRHGRLCGNCIEDIFLKHFKGKIAGKIDVEYRKLKP